MSDICGQHRAAFAQVAAYVVLDSAGDRGDAVAIRYPTRGLRLWAYVHVIGVEMVRGCAGGGGYDKASAPVAEAIGKVTLYDLNERGSDYFRKVMATRRAFRRAFRCAAPRMNAGNRLNVLARAGFKVCAAV
jgi:hypothetical protein